MFTWSSPFKLDSANVGNLSQRESGIFRFEIHNELAHRDRERPMMVLSLGLGGTKEADYAVGIKGRSGPTERTFRQAGFLRPFCRWDSKQGDWTNFFVQTLFRRLTPLSEQMIVVGSLSPFSLGL